MDTTSEICVTKKNVWQYYEKVSNYEARCRFCKKTYVYIYSQSKFYLHLNLHTNIIKYEKTFGRQEWPWIYFKYNDISTSQCLLCKCSSVNLQSTFQSLAHHLYQKHLNEMENYVLHDWIWKYFIIGDFEMKCIDCSNKLYFSLDKDLNYHIIIKHLNELTNVQDIRDVVLSSESVQSLKVIEVQENMWKYYTKLLFFGVKCKLQCLFQCIFLNNYNFVSNSLLHHITLNHRAISEWEQMHKNQKWPWMYFKYSFEYISDKNIPYSECLMCGKFFSTSCLSTVDHILDEHSEKERQDFTDDLWIIKYFKESDDSTKFKCTICCKKISININPDVFNHIITNHPKELQLNISKKNTQKLCQNYILEHFQAKCQSCDFASCYINTINFSEHVKKEHKEVFNFEEAYGHKYPWTYFTYSAVKTTSDYFWLQCRFCNSTIFIGINISSVSVFYQSYEHLLIEHLQSDNHRNVTSERNFNTLFDMFNDWIWKYCTQSNDFEVQCNICSSNIFLDVLLWRFNCHIEDCHIKHSIEQADKYTENDRTGPSESQSNRTDLSRV